MGISIHIEGASAEEVVTHLKGLTGLVPSTGATVPTTPAPEGKRETKKDPAKETKPAAPASTPASAPATPTTGTQTQTAPAASAAPATNPALDEMKELGTLLAKVAKDKGKDAAIAELKKFGAARAQDLTPENRTKCIASMKVLLGIQ